MKFQHKLSNLACLLIIAAMPAVVTAQGNLIIGFVNVQAALDSAPQTAKARENVEKEFAARQEKLRGLQMEIKALRDQLTRDGLTMSEADRSKMEKDLLKKDREFRWEQSIFDEDLKIRRNDILTSLQKDVYEAIIEIAQKEKYDLILTDGVVFGSERVNITDKVIEALKKQVKK